MTVPRRPLHATVPAVTIAMVVAGLLLGTRAVHSGVPILDTGPPLPPWQLSIAAGIAAVAQLARLHVRVGPTTVAVAWGEAAVVVLCSMLPLAWVGPAMVVGVGLSQLLFVALGEKRDGVQMIYSTSALTLAGIAAATVANLITPTYQQSLRPMVALALCAGALAYAVVGSWLVALRVAAVHGGTVLRIAGRTLKGKLLMLIGNIAIGLLVVALARTDKQWLVLLPPGLWLMHQTYMHRMRGDDERRVWQMFAEATRELNRLDVPDAAGAGLRGAMRLFEATSAVLLVNETDGGLRCYRGHPDGRVEECEPLGVDADPYLAARTLMVGGVRVGELRLRMASGRRMRHRDLLMFAAYGDALAAALHDATTHDALRAMTDRSSRDAVTDQLTGLANRAGFMSRGDIVVRELPADVPVALLLLDIDHFREVNDTLGHAAGDEMLQMAAERLRGALAPGEMVARLGGDEFAVLYAALPDDDEPLPTSGDLAGAEYPYQLTHAMRRARRLVEALAAPIDVADVRLSMESSVGVVVAAAGAVDLTELLRRADVAMYQAKRGGSSVAWYDTARDPASTDRLALLAELREALVSPDQLSLLIQPAVPLGGGPAVSGEALVRWQHPRRGTLPPAAFLSVVEHSELIGPFTRHVLDRALEIAAEWQAVGLDLSIAVNLSPRSLLDPKLPRDVAALLARREIRPDRLILEITETVVMSELPVIDDVLRKLRDLGVQLAVDDFGTGYSSLTFLTRVAVDQVKVDRTFVHRMVDSPEAAAIVRTTVDLGRRLGLRVVAEGVETAEQRAALVGLGCTVAQGFLFHHPMAPERAVEVLQELARTQPRRLRAEGTG